jgi:RHS repeat-associated protein
MSSPNPVRYFDGVALIAETDLSSDGFGTPWGQTRSWSNHPGYSFGSSNGSGWVDTQLPYLLRAETGDDTTIIEMSNANDSRYFDLAGSGYQARFFDQSTFVHNTAGTNHEFDLTDSSGDVIRFDDFSGSLPYYQRGQFEGFTDPGGNRLDVVAHTPDGQVAEVQRSGPSGGGTVVESFLYEYLPRGDPNALQLQRVTLRRQLPGSSTWSVVRKVQYAYYDGTQPYGNTGDLKTAQILDANNNVLDTTLYRYYTQADLYDNQGHQIGFVHGLKYVLNPASYARAAAAVGDPATAMDGQVAPYADNYFEYDPSTGEVTTEKVQGAGCSACSGGVGTYRYTYTASGNSPGYNSWSMKTVEALPDGNQNIVYTNAYGEVMLSIYHGTASNLNWPTFYQYDNQGRLLLQADPSAVLPPAQGDSYDNHPDLLHYQGPPNGYQYLAPAAGKIMRWDYYTATTAGDPAQGGQAGGVAGYLQDTQLQRGQTGTPVPQEAWQYFRHAVGSATDVPVATDTVYGLDHGTAADYSDRDPRTTRYAPTWFPGTVQEQSMTVTQPAIPTTQNGPGPGLDQFDVQTTYNDTYGRPVWTKDGDGYIDYTAYDQATGAVTKTITDVDYGRLSAAEQASFDATMGWPHPSGGLHLVSTMVVDGLGRTVQETDPNGHVTYTAYQDAAHLVATYPGWTAAGPTGPTQVSREDRPGGYTETFTASTAGTAWDPTLPQYLDPVTHRPTGGEFTDPNNVYAGAGLQTLARDYTNQAGQVIYPDAYFNLAGLTYTTATTLGAQDVNFYRTTTSYDNRGRPNRVVSPTGTITRTAYDGLGRVVSTSVGTNDTTSPNMVQTAAYYYDQPGGALDAASGVGDGNLTQLTVYPSGNPGTPPPDRRSTQSYYDWRDRPVATKEGALSPASSEDTATHRPITVLAYDNLGAVTQRQRYDGDQVAVTANGNGVTLTLPGGSTDPSPRLRAQSVTAYDDRGRVYLTQTYSVDPSTGAVAANTLKTNSWYDHRGNSIKTSVPGGLVTKTQYDGAGRAVVTYQTDGYLDSTWADAKSVANNYVLSQTETGYDGNGNVIQLTQRERFHNETLPGALTDPTGGTMQNPTPKARVSYAADYYDAADRLTASVDFGTNGGNPFTRPGMPPMAPDPALVSSYTYNAGGWVQDTIDPRGLDTRTLYDALGQTTQTIANYTGNPETTSSDVATEYTYDGSGHVLTVQADEPGGAYQRTQYVYGVSSATISSNDLLGAVQHPDKTSGNPSAAEQDSYTYNALGQMVTAQDRNGTQHTYSYDLLGRQTSDAVTTLGANVDGAVLRIDTAYDGQGNPYLYTSYDSATATATADIVNQVLRQYNGLGQMTAEFQSHAAQQAVDTTSTPAVRYTYSEMMDGGGNYVNHSRPVSMTYPNGRILHYGYNTGPQSAGLDDRVSRLSYLADDNGSGGAGTHLEDYSYLGLGTVVLRHHPETGVDLTYLQQAGDTGGYGDGGDPYTGLDRFGRVVDQRWIPAATPQSPTDRFQYGYDRDGNVLYRANLASPPPPAPGFDELYGYDGLNQLTSFGRGRLNATHDGWVGGASHSQGWALDALGNWASVTTDGVPQTRQHNQQNEITTGGVGYDPAGNTTADGSGNTFIYDAWNRLVAVGNGAVARYSYDGLGRRVTERHRLINDLYYSDQWQVLEERTGGSAPAQAQDVWSPVYVDALVLRDQSSLNDGNLDQRLYVQQDANWNVTALVDGKAGSPTLGQVVERYVYDPYGVASVYTPGWAPRLAGSAYGWLYLHQGGRHDPATGLYLFRSRDYSPTLGRWMQADPLGLGAGDTNLYRAEGNDPASAVDPSGLAPTLTYKPSTPPLAGKYGAFVWPIIWVPNGNKGVVLQRIDVRYGVRCEDFRGKLVPYTPPFAKSAAANQNTESKTPYVPRADSWYETWIVPDDQPTQAFSIPAILDRYSTDMGGDFPTTIDGKKAHDWFMSPHSGRRPSDWKLERKVTCGWLMVTATAYYYDGMTREDLRRNNHFRRNSWRTGMTGAGGLLAYELIGANEGVLDNPGELFGPATRKPEDMKKGPKFKKLETIPKGDVVTRRFFVMWDCKGKTVILQDSQIDFLMGLWY